MEYVFGLLHTQATQQWSDLVLPHLLVVFLEPLECDGPWWIFSEALMVNRLVHFAGILMEDILFVIN